uniref:Uncharacterized protein n=1 Tax=Canis lupus dingo TaxID=286419 RepID=A0A8C0QSX9_CANLU
PVVPSLEFITSWYSLSRQAMSCLAFCRASSSPASLHLASRRAASPCCSASATAPSSLQRWGRRGGKELEWGAGCGNTGGSPMASVNLLHLHPKWSTCKLSR